MDKLSDYFFTGLNRQRATRWFRQGLYVLVLVKCLYLALHYSVMLGENCMYLAVPRDLGWYFNGAYVLLNSSRPYAGAVFLGLVVLAVLVSWRSHKHWYVPELLLWWCLLNLNNKMYASASAGDYLLNQFLLFNVFLLVKEPLSVAWKRDWMVLLHNLAVVAVLVQVCLMYFITGLVKWIDADWLSGAAVVGIMQIRHFSWWEPSATMEANTWWTALLTYLVMGYQLLFSVLIWIRPLKKMLLWFGILTHVYIALFMGLPYFAAVVILGYVFFWPERGINSPTLLRED